MGLLDGLEKLVNEHGSAVILKERIALAEDKFAALEQKLLASEAANSQLQTENQGLRVSFEKAQAEIRSLEERLVERHGQRLEEIREQFLQLLVSRSDITSQLIAGVIGKSAQFVTFHLTEMERARLVHGSRYSEGETEWAIAQEGRAYLARHGLLA